MTWASPDIQFNLQLATRAWRTLQALRQYWQRDPSHRSSCWDSGSARPGRC